MFGLKLSLPLSKMHDASASCDTVVQKKRPAVTTLLITKSTDVGETASGKTSQILTVFTVAYKTVR